MTAEAQRKIWALELEVSEIRNSKDNRCVHEIEGRCTVTFAEAVRWTEEKLSILESQLAQYEIVHARHVREAAARQAEIDRLRAIAAVSKDVTRDLASRLRKRIAAYDICPYCADPIGTSGHVDHIYPVAKGGRSNVENLLWVCAPCNHKKGDLTLGRFCAKFGSVTMLPS